MRIDAYIVKILRIILALPYEERKILIRRMMLIDWEKVKKLPHGVPPRPKYSPLRRRTYGEQERGYN